MARAVRATVNWSRHPDRYSLAANYPEEIRRNVLAAQEENAQDLERTAKAEIELGARHGRIYQSHGHQHQASAASEPPASDTGTLDANIKGYAEPAILAATLEAKGRDVIPLEFGTRKMAPRPFLGRAAYTVLKRARARLGKAVKAAGQAVALR